MNKILLTSICAAAMTSAASAFTLDLSSVNGQILGVSTITNTYGSFTLIGSGSPHVTNGVVNLNPSQAFTILYPTNVTYIGAFALGNITTIDNGSAVQFVSNPDGTQVRQITFAETAVPEPSSTALLGLGGLALILRRRK